MFCFRSNPTIEECVQSTATLEKTAYITHKEKELAGEIGASKLTNLVKSVASSFFSSMMPVFLLPFIDSATRNNILGDAGTIIRKIPFSSSQCASFLGVPFKTQLVINLTATAQAVQNLVYVPQYSPGDLFVARAVNYCAGMATTLTAGSQVLLSVGCMAVGMTYFQYTSLEKRKEVLRTDLLKNMRIKFHKMADHVRGMARPHAATKAFAEQVLRNRNIVEGELSTLKVLSDREITDITAPFYEAAREANI